MKKDIDFDLLGQEISEMLYPLFEEIEKGAKINKTDFIEACYNLFDAFHIPQRNLCILKFNQPQVISEEEKLLKNISENLAQIEQKYLSDENHQGIWNRLYNEKIGKTDKMKQIEVEKMYNQMRECTFFPMKPLKSKVVPSLNPTLKREYYNIIKD
jgi:hypothetical protein